MKWGDLPPVPASNSRNVSPTPPGVGIVPEVVVSSPQDGSPNIMRATSSPTLDQVAHSSTSSVSSPLLPRLPQHRPLSPELVDEGAAAQEKVSERPWNGPPFSSGGAVSSTKGSSAPASSNIRVAVRVRPLPFADRGIIEVIGHGTIAIRKEAATGGNEFLSSQQGRTEERAFDRVFGPQATQLEVYEWCCRPLVEAAVHEGRSGTVFVYGATGAGKTHTMFGERTDTGQGLIFRAVTEVFQAIELSQSTAGLQVKVAFVELYNEKVYDLLQDGGGGAGGGGLCSLLEDERRGVIKIAGLKEVGVKSAEGAFQQLSAGMQLRKVESTAANSRSSRSHAIFILRLERVGSSMGPRCASVEEVGIVGGEPPGGASEDVKGPERRLHAKLCLIDLAGSERASQTQNVGAALRDGAKINQSLLALANCINALGDSVRGDAREGAKTPQRKPPYRDSKLTLLLKSSFVSGGLVSMIANVHPGQNHFEDSNNTLEYAKRSSLVRAPLVVRRDPREAASSLPARRRPVTQPGLGSSPPLSPGLELGPTPSGGSAAAPPGRPKVASDTSSTALASGRPSTGGSALSARPTESTGGGQPDSTGGTPPRATRRPPSRGPWRSRSDSPLQAAGEVLASQKPMSQALGDLPEVLQRRSSVAAEAPEKRRGAEDPPQSRKAQGPVGVSASLAGMRRVSPPLAPVTDPGADTPAEAPGDREVLLRIIKSLQAEKAAADARLSAVLADRDRLEAENTQLRAANLEKDHQLALLLSSSLTSSSG